jgi:RNA polymerase sigma-70 factor (ECF subfamily)
MSPNLSQLPEFEILTLVREGNHRAYGELYRRYLDEIYRYLYYRVAKNQLEAEDLAQEVFLKAWEVIAKKSKSRKNSNFRALLYRIAYNLAVDRWRSQKEDLSLDDEKGGIQISAADLPENKVLVQEQTQELVKAVRELESQLQNVFICRFINGLSHAETAQSLGLKEGHVRVLQYRALKKIRISVE